MGHYGVPSLPTSANQATPTVAAALAHDCLNSVPLHKDAAIQLVESIEPYLEWQSDPAYKADPPADYFYPAYDMNAALDQVKANLQKDVYANEYMFQEDLYLRVFAPGHDGHFLFYPDLLTRVFDFNRQRALVSISEDGTSLPVIKLYDDVISSPSTASVVTHINGIDAVKYVEDTIFAASFNQDADAAYNSMFFQLSVQGGGYGRGYFHGGGRTRFTYQGPNTTFTFANGTEAAFENYSRVRSSMAGVAHGDAMYAAFCNPNGVPQGAAASATATATPAQPTSTPPSKAGNVTVPGYPSPVAITGDQVVSCYFLDGLDDVVVLALLAFENESPAEFQAVTQECLTKAVAAGKTKLVVDFSVNGGGLILQGYDFFRQLFPHVLQDGFSRWRENDGFVAAAQIVARLVQGLNPATSDNADLIGAYESWFDYHYDLDKANAPFPSYDAKFSPHVYKGTPYTALMRWNLDDPLTTVNATFGLGIEITGYGSRANATQPFDADDIVMLFDGFCASTCTLAAEMLRLQGGVRSIAMGGRPRPGPIQGVGGIKGAQTLGFDDVYADAQYALAVGQHVVDPAQRAALLRYSDLAVNRSTAAALNTRDQILRGDVAAGLPAQYVREDADCRLYWTPPMLRDVTAVWRAVARAAFYGDACAAGAIDAKKKAPAPAAYPGQGQRGPYVPLPAPDPRTFVPIRRDASDPQVARWLAKHQLRAIP